MSSIERIGVFSASTSGNKLVWQKAAQDLASSMKKRGISLVYGGGCRGLMGTIASAIKDAGLEVYGVLPEMMDIPQVRKESLETTLVIAKDMHERKSLMYRRSDGFIALPGGIGTLEELSEIFCWQQLKLHKKPVALLNTEGFWNPLLSQLDTMTACGFLSQANRDALIVESDPEILLERMESFKAHLPEKLK